HLALCRRASDPACHRPCNDAQGDCGRARPHGLQRHWTAGNGRQTQEEGHPLRPAPAGRDRHLAALLPRRQRRQGRAQLRKGRARRGSAPHQLRHRPLQGDLHMLTATKSTNGGSIPFDSALLDRLMDDAGVDVLVATSKHNVQYLLGGHRAFFFDYMDAMGLSRYLPIFVYPKGASNKAAFFGHRLEGFQKQNEPFWVSEAQTTGSGSVGVMEEAADYIRKLGSKPRRIAAELGFLPVDAG